MRFIEVNPYSFVSAHTFSYAIEVRFLNFSGVLGECRGELQDKGQNTVLASAKSAAGHSMTSKQVQFDQ
jgi:hypothetical protein